VLVVFYDGLCPVCVRCKEWLEGSAQRVPLSLHDCRGLLARARAAELPWLGRELVVVSDRGEVWVGPRAFLVCLWALASWRWLAELLATELLWPLGEVAFELVSEHRGAFASLVGVDACHDGHCGAHPAAMTRGPFR
jgi:predicted DCC family thiol-disulfide oxidoreductase YuxK